MSIPGTIVIEGGAARGVFTAGVLDYLMEQDVYFSDVIGVSAGACNGIGYVAKQIGRGKDCMIHEKGSFSYINLKGFMKTKSLMDMDMIFDTFPNQTLPFDYDTYFASDIRCMIGVTNCITGKAEYLAETESRERLMRICRASSSLPLVAPIVNIDGVPYLDGGLAQSIPIQYAQSLGNEKMIFITTQNPGYRKKIPSNGMIKIYTHSYKKYPKLVQAIRRRASGYNATLEKLEALEKEGKAFVLRPQIPLVSRMESDPDKLTKLYDHGYDLMKKQFDNLMKYLETNRNE
ncbi:MAG: patatin family protein [Eubacteriales bacterium]